MHPDRTCLREFSSENNHILGVAKFTFIRMKKHMYILTVNRVIKFSLTFHPLPEQWPFWESLMAMDVVLVTE